MASWANPVYRVPPLTQNTCLPRTARQPETAVALTEPMEISVTVSPRTEEWLPNPVLIEARVIAPEPSPGTPSAPLPPWVKQTVTALVEIMQLAQNWDSYGARPVATVAVGRALDILTRVMGKASPAPNIVPLADGGLQMEWHTGNHDLEVVIPADEVATYYHSSSHSPADEGELLAPYKRVASLVSNLG